ncbi:MAG: hypothetical protein M3081_11555 [Gemmatimonadota bacterium]|nr:hypothetical protein [Gemmatimonadota bacterium]
MPLPRFQGGANFRLLRRDTKSLGGTLSPALSNSLFWSAVACCAVAQIFIVRGAFQPQRVDVQEGVPRPRRAFELAWTIVPAVALAVVLVFTWRVMHPEAPAGGRHSSAGSVIVAGAR